MRVKLKINKINKLNANKRIRIQINANDKDVNYEDTSNSNNSDSYLIDCLINVLLSTNQAFSLVENEEFINFVPALNKKCQLSLIKTIVDTKISNM